MSTLTKNLVTATKERKFAIAALMAGVAITLAHSASAVVIAFNDFSSTADQALLQTNGNAGFTGNVLRLTPDSPGQAGSAFFRQGLFIQSTTDFSTEFSFKIDSGIPGTANRSDGLAFVVQGSGLGLLGQDGGNLGYMGVSVLSPFYAIEFDTHDNVGDVSDNSVAVVKVSPGLTPPQVVKEVDLNPRGLFLDNGITKNVKIEYNFQGIARNLSVFVSEGSAIPQLVLNAVLPDDLFHFGGASTYLGFTAATGLGFATHDIISWKVNVPEPGTLPLLGIAALLGLWVRRSRGRTGTSL
jgi:hypothetical protein